MTLFFIFFSLGYLFISYTLRTILKTVILEPFKKKKLILLFDIFLILFFLGNILLRMNLIPRAFTQKFISFGYIFMGVSWIFFIFYFLNKLSNKTVHSESKRNFLKKSLGSLSLVSASALATKGYFEAMTPEVIRQTIKLPSNFSNLSGISITQISDLHLGPLLKKDFAEEIVETVNTLKSDIIVITGDLSDGKASDLQDDISPLKNLKAPRGVFYVLGNHEYYYGALAWIQAVRDLGINVLVDGHKNINIKGETVCIGGITDKTAKRLKIPHSFSPTQAFKNSPDKAYKILLAHRPKACFDAEGLGIHLQLSGHTHGGQAFPWNTIVRLAQPYLKGLYQHKDFQVYVNKGTGFWGPANRFLNKGEVTKITLS